jgi:alkylated DNA repair dioxygenase AlkB
MLGQADLFEGSDAAPKPAPHLPPGLRYATGLIDAATETGLIARIVELPLREFEFHGYAGKRRVVSFGWSYDFATGELRQAAAIPEFLFGLRDAAAAFAGLAPDALEQALVSEYRPGAGIGWHRDKAVFGQTIGVSLLASCVFRLRRKAGEKWQRANLIVEPRSAYVLSGEARAAWEHSIPPVAALRYSITFRSLRGA